MRFSSLQSDSISTIAAASLADSTSQPKPWHIRGGLVVNVTTLKNSDFFGKSTT